MSTRSILAIAAAAALLASPALAADRAKVAIDCKPAGDRFGYACIFKLTNARTGAPIEGAELTIGADMPSMPMAHNVKPVKAEPAGAPGEYKAHLALEMYGDWAVRLRISGVFRDQIVELKGFTEQGSGPPSKRAHGSKGGGHHKH